MTKEDIIRLRDTAEQTRVQFKERVTRDNKYDVSCEMVAQSNSRGGMIVVGIDDKTGRINPLSFVEVQEMTNLLGSLASEGVIPQILLDIENVQMEGGVIVVATVKQGRNKPYRDSKGIVWVKQGADKRKVFDNAELIAMLMENGKDIIQFCSIPRTAKEIMDHIGYYNNSKNMTTYVRPLLEMGFLEMTEPDKPKSKNQKYRKLRK